MKISLSIDYVAAWGQTVCVCGSIPQLGSWDESQAVEMHCTAPSTWTVEFHTEEDSLLEYRYFVKENGSNVRSEWGRAHVLNLEAGKTFRIYDKWIEIPQQQFLYTSGFSDSFFRHDADKKAEYYNKTVLFQIHCPYVGSDETLILCGSSRQLGEWQPQNGLQLLPTTFGRWEITIDATQMEWRQEYKFAIYNIAQNTITHWEEGENRIFEALADIEEDVVEVFSSIYRHSPIIWKAAGVAIPIFSLRSEDSFGIGEFSDLKKMIDWAAITQQKIIQILPINDTTTTHTWLDSYPYNAISIYALHPIYLGLKEHPLRDAVLHEQYRGEATKLNKLSVLDYEKVLSLKWRYLKDLFAEVGDATLLSAGFEEFYKQNEEWLFPYACFAYLRDKYNTARYTDWDEYRVFDRERLARMVSDDDAGQYNVRLLYFVQYLLHKQLIDAKEYAHQHGVILKGDIPIGISRDSVEAWVEPHLFNLDTQTGAPPDDFSVNGQNWGFPTYNWDEMAKDGYQWWIKRFRKMGDYFDAYRIDHILGFFRIWEIPLSSVQGLLGYFSPALPLSVDEMAAQGFRFDENLMTKPYISKTYLDELFGEYADEILDKYLHISTDNLLELDEYCNTQQKIKELFAGRMSDKSCCIRNGLYNLCNEVLFVKDKNTPHKYHPRITAQQTHAFGALEPDAREAYNRLYEDFFYRRHSQFWYAEAMKKLPVLISSTSMLVCGEDLGMIPECVPLVMSELQILSLEIERMPKKACRSFTDLANLPYLSVCATSTHDMSTIRGWWQEDKELMQKYYNEVLWKQGIAPDSCVPEISRQIVSNHLNSPAMLTVLPLQDWLSIDSKLRRSDPDQERINIPSVAQHYWQYRMHLTLEELCEADEINENIRCLINTGGRGTE